MTDIPNFNFIEMPRGRQIHAKGEYIKLRRNTISLSFDAFEKMGKPERVSLSYDRANKAIRVIPDPLGRKITVSGSYRVVSSPLGSTLPHGRYNLLRDGIFVYVEGSK